MWTETHFYRFDTEELFSSFTLPPEAAIDVIGAIDSYDGFHVNIRWWGEPQEGLQDYRVYPREPQREFA